MESSRNVSKIKYEHITNLSEQGLEQLLQSLARKYYQAFIDGDVAKFKSTIDFINEIELIVEDERFAFDSFVNYCMLCNANFIIKTIYKNGLDLKPYNDASIKTNTGVDNLVKSFNNSKYSFIHGVDRINIKNLHQMCKEDPTINAEIMAIVDALHESFVDKEKHKDEKIGGAANE